MKLIDAFLDILVRVDKRTKLETQERRELEKFIRKMPKQIDFSVQKSRLALTSIPGARFPLPPIELDDWLEEVAAETCRVSREKFATCTNGSSQSTITLIAYLLYITGYLTGGITPAKLAELYTIDRLRRYLDEAERNRPSDN